MTIEPYQSISNSLVYHLLEQRAMGNNRIESIIFPGDGGLREDSCSSLFEVKKRQSRLIKISFIFSKANVHHCLFYVARVDDELLSMFFKEIKPLAKKMRLMLVGPLLMTKRFESWIL